MIAYAPFSLPSSTLNCPTLSLTHHSLFECESTGDRESKRGDYIGEGCCEIDDLMGKGRMCGIGDE